MATYRITGTLYGTEPKYYKWDKEKKFPYFNKVETREWVREENNLENAINWLRTNYPEYYMGGSVQRINDEVCEFAMFAIPCPEYEPGTYETVGNRINYVKNLVA